jgi:hypothetical protein
MDGVGFDRLARTLGAVASRRQLLGVAGGTVLRWLVPRSGLSLVPAVPSRHATSAAQIVACCDGRCTDTRPHLCQSLLDSSRDSANVDV